MSQNFMDETCCDSLLRCLREARGGATEVVAESGLVLVHKHDVFDALENDQITFMKDYESVLS